MAQNKKLTKTDLFFCYSMCLGYLFTSVAALDLRMAAHRRKKNCTGWRLLHTVYTNEPIYHFRHRYCRILCTSDCDVRFILEDMEGNGKTPERPSKFTRRKTRQQQTIYLQVVVLITSTSNPNRRPFARFPNFQIVFGPT